MAVNELIHCSNRDPFIYPLFISHVPIFYHLKSQIFKRLFALIEIEFHQKLSARDP